MASSKIFHILLRTKSPLTGSVHMLMYTCEVDCVHIINSAWPITQPRSQGPICTSRKYPGCGWSPVCLILADSRDVIEGRDWKVIVGLH